MNHFHLFLGAACTFPRYFFKKKIQQITPPKISTVITSAIVENAPMLNSLTLSPERPILWATILATLSSYCKAPITDILNHENGTPSVPLNAITPNEVLIDGNKVNVALDVIALFKIFLSIPILIPTL